MILTTQLTVDDYKDFRRVRGARRTGRRSVLFYRLLVLGALAVVIPSLISSAISFAGIWQEGPMDALLDNGALPWAVGFALILLAIAAYWIYRTVLFFVRLPVLVGGNGADTASLRDGLDLGPAQFETLANGLRVTMPLDDEWYQWSAFEEVRETRDNLYLMLDGWKGVIVPKRAFPDAPAVHRFREMLDHEIGAAA